MILYLMRHGIAEDVPSSGQGDMNRALTREGREKTASVVKHIADAGIRLGALYTSPVLRAKQTADIVAESLYGGKSPTILPQLSTSGSMRALFEVLHDVLREEHTMLVGHEPTMSMLTSLLISGRDESRITFRKAAVAALDLALTDGRIRATLQWYVTYGILGTSHH